MGVEVERTRTDCFAPLGLRGSAENLHFMQPRGGPARSHFRAASVSKSVYIFPLQLPKLTFKGDVSLTPSPSSCWIIPTSTASPPPPAPIIRLRRTEINSSLARSYFFIATPLSAGVFEISHDLWAANATNNVITGTNFGGRRAPAPQPLLK
jgi:hypothetical protein